MIVVDHTDMLFAVGWDRLISTMIHALVMLYGQCDPIARIGAQTVCLRSGLDEGLIHPASLLQDVPRRTVIIDQVTLTAVFMGRSA